MTEEQKRLKEKAEQIRDNSEIKSSDSIIVLVANKKGMWAAAGNKNVDIKKTIENINKELNESNN